MRRAVVMLALTCGCSTVSSGHDASRVSLDAAEPVVVQGPSPESAALDAARQAVDKAEAAAAPQEACVRWPLWQAYAERFIQPDGRVVDSRDGRSTSEGQSYALFFALVADDRARFERVLAWTEENLSAGSLQTRLPAWHWGKQSDGSYGVIDPNAASDADVWLAYTLLEAGRLWNEPRYHALARALVKQIVEQEVLKVDGLGPVLLPAPEGFVDDKGVVRLNPSYLVLPLFRRFESEKLAGPWKALASSSARVLAGSAPRGLAPDWIAYVPGKGFRDDPVSGALGSYDAVRVYLWSALVDDGEPFARTVRKSASGLFGLLSSTGKMPEKVDVRSAEINQSDTPAGFLAVALAYAQTRGDARLLDELRTQLEQRAHDGLYGDPPAYYDQNLALFALGFVEGRYQLATDGHLSITRNEVVCAPQ